ncbi:hepatic lectin-like [Hypanus sabinus]|uniref:hepatic lectin-like n=1 Tax=Hypanus sabinus TaxID=79690 RepID=UPI0028C4688D|nr:hepatic lectin-like [Hypanus sabinus]
MDVKGSYEVSGGGTGRKLSPLIIYVLLGLSVLMSFVILGTVVHLITENSMKTTELQDELTELAMNLSHGQPFNKWRRFNHKLYYISSNRHSWNESFKFCASMQSMLVVINSRAEQEFLQRNIKCGHWIGLHDTEVEGVWRWVDGSDYATNFKNWAPGQPNTVGAMGQDCALIVGSGVWYSWHCNFWHYPICEKPED